MVRNPLITVILTQYHVSKGLKVFGKTGVAAVLKELKQLHDIMVMDLKNSNKMTTSQKKAALQYLMFLKQNRCGKINRRGCADNRKKSKYLTKENTSAPTVETEDLFLTFLVHTMEHRKVVTVDIPGAFMQADMEGETVHMKLEGKIAELLENLDPNIYIVKT